MPDEPPLPVPPKKFHEIFTSITNNYRFIPFDRDVAPAAVRVPDGEENKEDERPRLDHSTPLPNGYSGRITMHWVARTPVLFGGEQVGGITRPQTLHSGPDAPYCIPGSSLRGMIRRLLRIATKGRAAPLANSRPALRDPTYQKKQVHEANGMMLPPKTGWLMFDAEAKSWSILQCEKHEIAHNDATIAELNLADLTVKDLRSLQALLTPRTAQLAGGHLILTGGMPGGTRNKGKQHEAIFHPAANDATPIPVCDSSFNSFRQAYGKIDGRSKTAHLVPESNLEAWLGHFLHKPALPTDWRMALAGQFDLNWANIAQQCPAGIRPDNPPGIPVYYYPEDTETKRLLVIGMTQIMRFPAKYTVHEVRDRTQPNAATIGRDWSEAMLGYVDKDGKAALRGRIDFGFAKALGTPKLYPDDGSFIRITQGPPRPGFFPFYLRRTGKSNKPWTWLPATFDSTTAHLAGRKYYAAWNSGFDGADNLPRWREGDVAITSMESLLQFLDRGTILAAQIDVHNLLPEELGALLWVLSLGEGSPFCHFDPDNLGERPNESLSPYCHIAGRARSFSFGNLIPAGIDLTKVIPNSGSASATPEALIAAFARIVHGCGEVDDLAAVEWLNSQSRLARLRHLSNRERDPDTIGPTTPQDGDGHFAEYRLLRKAASSKSATARTHNDQKKLTQYKINLAASPANEMGGNILDLGSDPDPA